MNESYPGPEQPIKFRGRAAEIALLRLMEVAIDKRVSAGAVRVFVLLQEYCDRRCDNIPGPTWISHRAGLSLCHTKRNICLLEKLGYVEVLRPGPRRKNMYRLRDVGRELQ